jgi:hypothetical protein
VLGLGGAVLALALVAALVALASPRTAPTSPAGSPEAAFQAFYTAWQERNLEAAYALLSDRLRAQATLDQYRQMDRDFGWGREQDRRVTLAGSRVNGEHATLDLQVEDFHSGGPLGGGWTSTWKTSVPLIHEGGAWHIDEFLAGLEPMPAPAKW